MSSQVAGLAGRVVHWKLQLALKVAGLGEDALGRAVIALMAPYRQPSW
eukprot:SAG22_NODE_121_length_19129_cov_36.644614_13_plen_48_part_00